MKPFLGIDLTTNKKNKQMNGEEFVVAKPDLSLTQSLESSSENVEETIEKSKLPLPIRIGHWICGAVGVLVVIGIIKALGGEDGPTLSEAYRNASWLFWLGGACLVVWALLKLISIRKEKDVLETEESSQVFNQLDKTCDAILTDLKVPQDAKEINILSFFYKVKGENIKVCEKGLQIAPYINPIFHIFADSENLYLANLEGKYAIPLSAIKGIKSIKKTIRILEWNKDEEYNKGIYKQHKLSEDNYGCIICNSYHILEFEHNNDLWGIYIPCYELSVIEEITGLKAEPT
ncbi:MAG: hypothetical protein PUB22_06555 [Clostridiales bacterium]|nr:hypothetical protein [Clostridiales bacterium]